MAPTDRDTPVVVATRNRGKLAELRTLLAPLGRRLIDLATAGIPHTADEEIIENADTFEGNALAKAQYFHARTGGAAVIADDSGLCVDALVGAPGVRSRRYAGAAGSEADVSAANARLLLHELATHTERRAEFVCAIAYVDVHTTLVVLGRTVGRILHTPTGSEGFGYDPLFWSDELRAGFGEVGAAEKARVSHRARAAEALIAQVRARMPPRAVDGAR